MEITKVVKHLIKRGWPNTFGNILYMTPPKAIFSVLNNLYLQYRSPKMLNKHTEMKEKGDYKTSRV